MSWFRRNIIENMLSGDFRRVLNGSFLNTDFLGRQIGIIIIVVIFAVIYITDRMTFEQQLVQEDRLKTELKDLKYQSLRISSELTKQIGRADVLRRAQEVGLGLSISKTAPYYVGDSVE